MLVPMLAFNLDKHRLGYGGGYYDRTIDGIRRGMGREVVCVGVGFEVQKEDGEFERMDTDERLDYIITEKCIYT